MRLSIQKLVISFNVRNGQLIKNNNDINIALLRCLFTSVTTLQTDKPDTIAKSLKKSLSEMRHPNININHRISSIPVYCKNEKVSQNTFLAFYKTPK